MTPAISKVTAAVTSTDTTTTLKLDEPALPSTAEAGGLDGLKDDAMGGLVRSGACEGNPSVGAGGPDTPTKGDGAGSKDSDAGDGEGEDPDSPIGGEGPSSGACTSWEGDGAEGHKALRILMLQISRS